MGDEPDHTLSGDAAVAVGVQSRVAVTLGEASAVRAANEREVEVGWLRGVAQGAGEEELPASAFDEVVAANDVGDGLAEVIDDDGELIGGLARRGSVSARPDDEVADGLRGMRGLRARELVVERDWLGRRHEPPGRSIVGEGGGKRGRSQQGRKNEFVRAFVRCALGRSECFEFAAGVRVRKGVSIRDQMLHRGVMMTQIVRLDDGASVPVDAQPSEQIDGEIEHARLDARGVEVLDAEDDAHVLLTGQGPSDQKCARVAEVERAGGAGGQTGGRSW